MRAHRGLQISTTTLLVMVVALSGVIVRATFPHSAKQPLAHAPLPATLDSPRHSLANIEPSTREALRDVLTRSALRGLSLDQQVQGRFLVTHEPLWTLTMYQPSSDRDVRTSSVKRQISDTTTHVQRRAWQGILARIADIVPQMIRVADELARDIQDYDDAVSHAQHSSPGVNVAAMVSWPKIVALQWTAPHPVRSGEHDQRRHIRAAHWTVRQDVLASPDTFTWTMGSRSALGRWPDCLIDRSARWSPEHARAPPLSAWPISGPEGGV